MEVYTAAECSKYLNVCYDTITRMVRRKEIPHFRIGKKILFNKQIIDEWVKNGGTF